MWTDLIQPIMAWMDSGDPRDLLASPAGAALAFILPSTIIALLIGFTHLRETTLAAWIGMFRGEPEADWTERARDIDKDGAPDF